MVGDNVVVKPTHIIVGPAMLMAEAGRTVTSNVALEIHPVDASVNVNDVVPAETPVTTPLFVTVAMDALLLAQVPPELGNKLVVDPIQISLLPLIDTTGFG